MKFMHDLECVWCYCVTQQLVLVACPNSVALLTAATDVPGKVNDAQL